MPLGCTVVLEVVGAAEVASGRTVLLEVVGTAEVASGCTGLLEIVGRAEVASGCTVLLEFVDTDAVVDREEVAFARTVLLGVAVRVKVLYTDVGIDEIPLDPLGPDGKLVYEEAPLERVVLL